MYRNKRHLWALKKSISVKKKCAHSGSDTYLFKCLAWLRMCYHYHWMINVKFYLSSFLLLFFVSQCWLSDCRPRAALSNLKRTQCTAWSVLQNSRNGLILNAIQKSLIHSTYWPCIKVKLLVISKVCILAYIECRT